MMLTKEQIAELQEDIRKDLKTVSEEDLKHVYKAWKKILELTTSHEEALTKIETLNNQLWAAEDLHY